MSWLSSATGVHISPKGTWVDPKQLGKAALTAGGVALGGAGLGLAGKYLAGKMGAGGSGGETPPPGAVKQDGNGNWLDSLGNFISSNAGTLLGAGGAAIGAYESAQQTKDKLAQQNREFGVTSAQQAARDAEAKRQADANLAQRIAEAKTGSDQFGRTTGDTEAQAAVRAQTQLNKSPIADKAQALILARMGVSPGAFQPRDITRGVQELSRPSVAPGANVATTMQNAAANYKPGQGGINNDVLRGLITKMTGQSGLIPESPTGPAQPPNPLIPRPPVLPITPKLPPLQLPPTGGVEPPGPPKLALPPISTGGSDGAADDTGGGQDQEPDPTDPAEALKRKLRVSY